MIKRNSIVSDERENRGGWTPFGRVVKIKSGMAFVIFCTRDSAWIPIDKLKVHDYKGRWERKYLPSYWQKPDKDWEEAEEHVYYVWFPMPTLRKLKQMASHYNPKIWNEK